jgi:hypothetical protein
MPTQKTAAQEKKKAGRAKVAPKTYISLPPMRVAARESTPLFLGYADALAFWILLVFGLPALLLMVAFLRQLVF